MPDGRVQAEVEGVKGKACTDYVNVLEEILDAEVIESHYTPEYYEENRVESQTGIEAQEQVKNRNNT